MTKQISLNRLSLRNFKGIRDFTLETGGENVKIYADNAVGKTTLFDAFTWLLFDKDSQNKKDFEIKTLDAHGNILHNLNHEVEGTFLIDGKQITFRKVFSEKWTKKRGAATAEFAGHTTEYYIDGVPAKKNEYIKRVDEIIKEDIFKLITSPTYFNEQMKWQDRRKILLEVCGNIEDQEVIEKNKELSKLPVILNGRKLEDHRKVIASRRAELNKELDKIPVRIDEVNRTFPDVSGLDESKLKQEIDLLKVRIEEKESELIRIKSGGEVSAKEKRLREIEGELLQIKNNLQAGTMERLSSVRNELSVLKNEHSYLHRDISNKKWEIEQNNNKIAHFNNNAGRLRHEWHEVNGEEFQSCQDTNCPTCGQALQEERVKEAHEKAVADFNKRKAQRLEGIVVNGKAAATQAKCLEDDNASLNNEVKILEAKFAEIEGAITSKESEHASLQAGMTDVQSDPQYISKINEISIIKQEIDQLQVSMKEYGANVQKEISILRTQVDSLEQEKTKFSLVHSAERRIAELAEKEKELAIEYERLEHEIYLTEEFIRTKVDLLEEKINQKFEFAKFKLFEQQVNGGLAEVCETTYNGVPYSSGLNNASRINVGLDIINTLSEHYRFSATIFIDNRESVTRLIDTKAQVISLIVSEKDKSLRVETKTTMMEAI